MELFTYEAKFNEEDDVLVQAYSIHEAADKLKYGEAYQKFYNSILKRVPHGYLNFVTNVDSTKQQGKIFGCDNNGIQKMMIRIRKHKD